MVNMAYKERIRDKWTGFFFYALHCAGCTQDRVTILSRRSCVCLGEQAAVRRSTARQRKKVLAIICDFLQR